MKYFSNLIKLLELYFKNNVSPLIKFSFPQKKHTSYHISQDFYLNFELLY